MQVNYRNRQIEKVCTDASAATKKYGIRAAGLIHQRVDEIGAADSVEMLVQFGIGRCHQLLVTVKGNLQWTWCILSDWYLKSLEMRFR